VRPAIVTDTVATSILRDCGGELRLLLADQRTDCRVGPFDSPQNFGMGRLEPAGAGQRPIQLDRKPGAVVLQDGEFFILVATCGIRRSASVGGGLQLAESRRKAPQGSVEICRQAHGTAIRRLDGATIWRNDRLKVNELQAFVHRTNEP
jgi:hypothetical protein